MLASLHKHFIVLFKTGMRMHAGNYTTMKKIFYVVVNLCIAFAACIVFASQERLSVLLIGNSNIYTNNLPLFMQSLTESQSRNISIEMLVQGGATISHRLTDSSLLKTTKKNSFNFIVLQERGGDLFCASTEGGRKTPDCANIINHYKEAQSIATDASAGIIILGTYQFLPAANYYLREAEAWMSDAINADYANVINAWTIGRQSQPDMEWLYADEAHPGKDLTLLMGLLIYREIFDEWPVAKKLVINGPIYTPSQHFDGSQLASEQTIAGIESSTVTISKERFQAILDIATNAETNPPVLPEK